MGAIVNAVVILIVGVIGAKIKSAIPERMNKRLMEAIGLCIVVMGIAGAIEGQNTLLMILSMVIGTLIGEGLDLDGRIISAVNQIEARFIKSTPGEKGNLAQGFISATMIFCVGSMIIIGSLESGLTGDNSTLYIKSLLDGITGFLLASSLGVGVALSALPVLVIEGGLTLLATFLAPFLADAVVTEIISVGSVLLIGLGLNMAGLSQFKIMNFAPAIILPPILMLFF